MYTIDEYLEMIFGAVDETDGVHFNKNGSPEVVRALRMTYNSYVRMVTAYNKEYYVDNTEVSITSFPYSLSSITGFKHPLKSISYLDSNGSWRMLTMKTFEVFDRSRKRRASLGDSLPYIYTFVSRNSIDVEDAVAGTYRIRSPIVPSFPESEYIDDVETFTGTDEVDFIDGFEELLVAGTVDRMSFKLRSPMKYDVTLLVSAFVKHLTQQDGYATLRND